MKIITLNTWGGRAGKEVLLAFFEKNKDSTDIFCLQEIWAAPHLHEEGLMAGGWIVNNTQLMTRGLEDISNLLSDFNAFFRPHYGDNYGLLMLVKKGIDINVEGEIFVHKDKGYIPEGDLGKHARNIQFITTEYEGTPLTIINFHGLWNGQGKGDSEDRLNQSNKIKEFIETLNGNVILCGDFNLLPDTKSIQILEDMGLKNLIKENNISSTRTSFYTKTEKFADYVFVTPDIAIKDFKVLPDEVSDHAPLYLEIGK